MRPAPSDFCATILSGKVFSSSKRYALRALAVALFVLVAAIPNFAATLTVTSLLDDGSAGTLRSTIASSSGNDTIIFSVTGNIQLDCQTYGSLVISQNLIISGPGAASLAINGSNSQCSLITVNVGVTATISGLSVENGINTTGFGGDISNNGTLTLNNCTVSGGTAQAGGGIWNSGTLVLNGDAILNNTAFVDGGGISNKASLAITNSTLKGNASTGGSAEGGGIYNQGSATVSNSTFAANLALKQNGTAGTGGGIYNTGQLGLKASLLANEPMGGNCSATVVSDGYNLDDDGSCALINTGDQSNVTAASSFFGALDTSGPTPTLAVIAGSTAIDAIPLSACTDPLGNHILTDQRGIARPQGLGCDIGAYEVTQVPTANVCPAGIVTPACSTTISLQYTVPPGDSLGANPVSVVTQGAPNLDFKLDVSDTTCTSAATGYCVVSVTFGPLAPGLRMGAVNLSDNSGNLLAKTLISGTGVGPAVAFLPGNQTSLNILVNGLGAVNATGMAIDAVHNIYITDFLNNRVLKIPGGCMDTSCQSVVNTGALTLNGPSGVAVDGAGDLFIADNSNGRVVEVPASGAPTVVAQNDAARGVAVDGTGNLFVVEGGALNQVVEIPANGGTQKTIGLGISMPDGVAVDAVGNVYITDFSFSSVVTEVPVGCTTSACQISVNSGLIYLESVAIDAAGNLFVVGDNGLHQIAAEEIPAGCTSSDCMILVPSGGQFPSLVQPDAEGNIFFLAGTPGQLFELERSRPPSMNFPTPTPDGSADSTDGAITTTIQNIGNAALNAVTPGLAIGADFTQTFIGSDCTSSFSLIPGAICNLSITFAPQSPASGPLSELASLIDNSLNDSPAEQDITLQGTAIAQTFTIGGTVSGLSGTGLTLQNNGGNYLSVVSNGNFAFPAAVASGSPYLVTVFGQPSNSMQTCSVTNGSGTVASGNVANVQVSCVNNSYQLNAAASPSAGGVVTPASGPQSAGSSVALLAKPNPGFVFANWTGPVANSANSSTTVTMTAAESVTANFAPAITVSPSTYNFGNAIYLGSIITKNFTVTNNSAVGTSAIGITGPFVSIVKGGNSNEFVEVNLCGKSLAAGAHCTISVSFVAGPYYTQQTATLSVMTNSGANPAPITLTAMVINPQANLKPSSLNFGTVSFGKTSAAQAVTLTNTGAGTVPLNITSISVTGANAANFAANSSACPASLTPGAHCSITITFTPPKNTGSYSANLTVKDNAQSATQNVSLTGKGSH